MMKSNISTKKVNKSKKGKAIQTAMTALKPPKMKAKKSIINMNGINDLV